MLYNSAIEEAAQKFSELPGNLKHADVDPHSTGNSYFALESGRLEGMVYEVLEGKDDFNCESELFPEFTRSVILRSLFNRFSSTLLGVGEVENGDYRLCIFLS